MPPPPQSPLPSSSRGWPIVLAVVAAIVVLAAGTGAAIALTRGGGDEGGSDESATTTRPPATTEKDRRTTDTRPSRPPEEPRDRVEADRTEIGDLLRAYARAYTDQSRDEMEMALTPSVSREGVGSPGCVQRGREEVLAAYENQWTPDTGSYELRFDPSGVDVGGATATLERSTYSIGGGESRRIDFGFERTGGEWRISSIDAIFEGC